MTEKLIQTLEILGQDHASAEIRAVISTMKALERQAQKTSETLKRSFGTDLAKAMTSLRTDAKAFGTGMVEAAERAAQALRTDTTAATELRAVLTGVVAEIRETAQAAKASQRAVVEAIHAEMSAVRELSSARQTAAREDAAAESRIARTRTRNAAGEIDQVRRIRRERTSAAREAARYTRDAGRHSYHALRRVNHHFTKVSDLP